MGATISMKLYQAWVWTAVDTIAEVGGTCFVRPWIHPYVGNGRVELRDAVFLCNVMSAYPRFRMWDRVDCVDLDVDTARTLSVAPFRVRVNWAATGSQTPAAATTFAADVSAVALLACRLEAALASRVPPFKVSDAPKGATEWVELERSRILQVLPERTAD